MQINLLPSDIKLELRARVALRWWGLIWAFCGAGLIAYCTWEYGTLRETKAEATRLSVQCQPLHTLQEQIKIDYQQTQALLEEEKILNRIQSTDHLIELLAIIVKATRHAEGHLQIQRLDLLARQSAETTNTPSPSQITSNENLNKQPKSLATLTMQGVADNEQILAQFVSGLRASEIFERVDLKSSSQLSNGNSSDRHYELECRYEDQP